MKYLALALILPMFSLSAVCVAKGSRGDQVIPLSVTLAGFEPAVLTAKTKAPIILEVTRLTDSTCATEIVIPKLKIKKELPLNKKVRVRLGSLAKGLYPFGCGMALMLKGDLQVR